MTAPVHVEPVPAAPVAVPRPARTNGLAIATLVLGLCGFALLPVILGHVALRQIRVSGEGGTALAVVGLVLGYLALAAYVVLVIVLAVASVWAVAG